MAQPTVSASVSANPAGSTTITFTGLAVGSGETVICAVTGRDGAGATYSSATWNGGAVTVSEDRSGTLAAGIQQYFLVFRGLTAGTFDLVLTFSAIMDDLYGTARSFANVHQTTSTSAISEANSDVLGQADPAFLVFASATSNDLSLTVFRVRADLSSTLAAQSGQANVVGPTVTTNGNTVISSTETGAASVSSGYTFDDSGFPTWEISGIVVLGTAGGTDTTITPTVGSLTTTGIAPTVRQGINRVPVVGALVATGIAAILTSGTVRVPQVGALTLTGVAPTVSATGPVTRTPVVGSLALTGIAPTVRQNINRTPVVGSLTLTGVAPGLTLTLASPEPQALVLTGYAPTVSVSGAVTRTPVVGALAITGIAPTVQQNIARVPAVGSLAITGIAPAVTQQLRIAPNAGTLTLTGNTPALNGAVIITPAGGSLALTGIASTLRSTVLIAPDTGALSISGITADVRVPQTITPNTGSMSFAGIPGVIVPISTARTSFSIRMPRTRFVVKKL